MISLHFDNLLQFIPQYVAATISAVLIYFYLGQKFPGRENTLPVLRRNRMLGSSIFNSPIRFRSATPSPVFSIMPGTFGDSLRSYWTPVSVFFDLTYSYISSGFPDQAYSDLKSGFDRPAFFESSITYQIYRITFAISAWAGLLLVITPFSHIYVFIPHFSDPYNIIVAIILSIAIFEGIISTTFFRIGVTFSRTALVVSLVIVAFTLSLLSPSMSWMSSFNMQGRFIVYLVLLLLFAATTALISQLRTKRNLFLSSMAFSIIAYFAFVAVVLYNVLDIIGA